MFMPLFKFINKLKNKGQTHSLKFRRRYFADFFKFLQIFMYLFIFLFLCRLAYLLLSLRSQGTFYYVCIVL